MKLTTLEDLVCPGCLGQDLTESSLSISSLIPTHIKEVGNATEVLEAILICEKCKREYPIAAGVLIAVSDVAAYLRKQFGSIVSNCVLCECISPLLIDYMIDKRYNLAKIEAREYYDSPRKLSTYICGHYDDITQLVLSNNSFGKYLLGNYQNFYSAVLKLWEQIVPLTFERKRSLDIGSYVGGTVNRFAGTFERMYGIDYSFAGTLLARQIQIGYPTPVTEYDLYLEGDIRQRRKIVTSLKENVDFLVASALNLPFRPASFNLTTSLNLLELVSSPALMIRELRRVSKIGAHTILTSPYWWEEDEASTSEWIGGQGSHNTIDSLSFLLEELGITLLTEQVEVPWILRYNSRAFMSFIDAVMIGKVIR